LEEVGQGESWVTALCLYPATRPSRSLTTGVNEMEVREWETKWRTLFVGTCGDIRLEEQNMDGGS
jgi:hypothetical protein